MASADDMLGGPPASTRDNLPTSGRVWVGCKMPNGLILRHQVKRTKMVPGRFGMTEETISEFVMNKAVILDGSRAKSAEEGFGITSVDAAWFARWYDQNDGLPLIEMGLLLAHAKRDGLLSEIRNRAKLRSDFEPIAQDAVPGILPDLVSGGAALAGTL